MTRLPCPWSWLRLVVALAVAEEARASSAQCISTATSFETPLRSMVTP
jgi:hypothetical protein